MGLCMTLITEGTFITQVGTANTVIIMKIFTNAEIWICNNPFLIRITYRGSNLSYPIARRALRSTSCQKRVAKPVIAVTALQRKREIASQSVRRP